MIMLYRAGDEKRNPDHWSSRTSAGGRAEQNRGGSRRGHAPVAPDPMTSLDILRRLITCDEFGRSSNKFR